MSGDPITHGTLNNEIKEKQLDKQDPRAVLLDLVARQMISLLSLFSLSSKEISSLLESAKTSTPSISDVIDAMCNHTYRTLSKARKDELEKKSSDSRIQEAVRDLVTILLKRENRADVPMDKEEINTLFIEWVNLQKTKENT